MSHKMLRPCIVKVYYFTFPYTYQHVIPSTNMITLVKFTIYVYASSWFGIRRNFYEYHKPTFTKHPHLHNVANNS